MFVGCFDAFTLLLTTEGDDKSLNVAASAGALATITVGVPSGANVKETDCLDKKENALVLMISHVVLLLLMSAPGSNKTGQHVWPTEVEQPGFCRGVLLIGGSAGFICRLLVADLVFLRGCCFFPRWATNERSIEIERAFFLPSQIP